jgi:RNA polymerase Rpb5, N-terminal domain
MDMEEDDGFKLSEEGEKELTRLWRTWKTVIEMLMDRV